MPHPGLLLTGSIGYVYVASVDPGNDASNACERALMAGIAVTRGEPGYIDGRGIPSLPLAHIGSRWRVHAGIDTTVVYHVAFVSK